MDNIDRKILTLLQGNARMSIKAISQQTFLSAPAVGARIERMEKAGIITGYHASVNPFKLGYHVMAFISIDVKPENKEEFYVFAGDTANVLECSYVTGEYSMLLKVAFESTMDLDDFLSGLQRFGRCSTQIVFSTHVGPRGVDAG